MGMLPLSNINSHDSADSEKYNDEKDNPYLISVSKDSADGLEPSTPHNTPREVNQLDIDILNSKLNSLARITSVNSGSYLSDYQSLTPLSKDSSASNLYRFNSSSSGNTSKQVSNANLKKMMMMTAHTNQTPKYKLSTSNTKLQPGFAEMMSLNSISSGNLKNTVNFDSNYHTKNKFQLHPVNSRESDLEDGSDEEDDTKAAKLHFPKFRDTGKEPQSRSASLLQLTQELKNHSNHDSDCESNFSIVSSLEAKSPKFPFNFSQAYQPSITPLPEQPSASSSSLPTEKKQKLKYVFILSGLPASGKSTLSQNMIQYMTNTYLTSPDNDATPSIEENERGIKIPDQKENANYRTRPRRNSLFAKGEDPKRFNIEIFNAGKIRRSDSYTRTKKLFLMANNSNEDLFSPKNKSKKDVFAKLTLDSLFKNLKSDKLDMAIFDATNSTRERRRFVVEEIAKQQREMQQTKTFGCSSDEDVEIKIVPVFLQIMCTNREFIRYNIYNKSFNDDYFDKPFDFAVKDFSKRVLYYSQQYCPITKDEINDLEDVMRENGCSSDLYYINLENSADSSYESNISEMNIEEDGILAGLLDFAQKYNSLPESITYVKNVGKLLETIDGWNFEVLEENLNDEYFNKLNRNLQRTCNKYGVKVPLIK